MEWCDWLVAIYCLAAGAGVIGFWVVRLSARRVALGDAVMRHHLAAEFVTGCALLAGGIATFASPRHGVTLTTVGLGIGLLVYASLQSQPFYPDEPEIRAALWFTLALAVTAFVFRLATL